MAEREKPDLVLMDMSLPVLDGWDAMRRLRLIKIERLLGPVAR